MMAARTDLRSCVNGLGGAVLRRARVRAGGERLDLSGRFVYVGRSLNGEEWDSAVVALSDLRVADDSAVLSENVDLCNVCLSPAPIKQTLEIELLAERRTSVVGPDDFFA